MEKQDNKILSQTGRVHPGTIDELSAFLAEACRAGGKLAGCDLSSISALIEHRPEDMTATIQGGMTLGRFQEILGAAHQWLPVDPPNQNAITIADLLAFNLSGPRRFGYGTIRDYLIGIKVVLGDGQVIKAGGKVVKNVAGYDLCKLFIGAQHSLGIVVEAVFKLRPRPEIEMILERTFSSMRDLEKCARELLDSDISPVILDASAASGGIKLVAGFAGTREDVAWQVEQARTFGFVSESNTEYDAAFWSRFPGAEKRSVLPSDTVREIEKLNGAPFVSRLGNGIIFSPAILLAGEPLPAPHIQQRIKAAYDPKHTLPDYQP